MTGRPAFQDHFSGVAARYAASRPAYPAELFEFVATAAPATDTAWDCATGNGQAAIGLARHFGQVYATDASETQIDNATRVGNIAYSVQLAEKTAFPDRYFDAVTIAQALHWFDLDAFKLELARVLKPRAVVMAWTYGFFRIDAPIDTLVRAKFLEPISSFWPEANASAWSGYSDVKIPFHRIDTPDFELGCDWNLPELMTYLSTWSAATRYTEANGPGLIDELAAAMSTVWGDPEQKRTVDMDFYLLAWRNE